MDKEKMLPSVDTSGGEMMLPDSFSAMMEQMAQSMRVMAEAMRATNESVAMLQRQVQQMVPLTSPQKRALNQRIKQRAQELREQYRLKEEAESAITAAIRNALKLSGGVRSVAELPRAMYAVHEEQVALWDDYTTMRAIKKKYAA